MKDEELWRLVRRLNGMKKVVAVNCVLNAKASRQRGHKQLRLGFFFYCIFLISSNIYWIDLSWYLHMVENKINMF